MGVFANARDVQIVVVPQHFGDGLLLLPRFPPGEVKWTHVRRRHPGRLVELAVNDERRAGAMDQIDRRLEGADFSSLKA